MYGAVAVVLEDRTMSEADNPGAGPTPARRGILGVAVLGLSLGGLLLWSSMLLGPWNLATGLLSAGDHLDRAEKKLSQGLTKDARYETLAAAAASRRARAALARGGPIFDLLGSSSLGPVLEEAEHLVSAAEHSAAAAVGTLSIAQSALKGPKKLIVADPDDPKGSKVQIDRVEALADTVTEIRSEITASGEALRAVNLPNLPRRARGPVTEGIDKAEEASQVLGEAEAGLAVLPQILGKESPRTYLIGFQNSAEQRGTGGAILQFAEVTMDEGALELEKAASVYKNIDKDRQPIFSVDIPEDAWYVEAIDDAKRFGNANWSPDWPASAQLTLEYGRATPSKVEFPEVDGVINVDPVAIEMLLPGTGPFTTEPSNNRITEEKVVAFLLYKAYASYPVAGVRRVVLNQVVDKFYEKLLKPAHPTELVQGMGDALGQKHMQIWMADPDEQAFMELMNWDGAIEEAKGDDYVFVVEQNVGGSKLDYFDSNTTTMNISFEGEDAVVSTELRVLNRVFLPQPRYSMGDAQAKTACAASRCPAHKPMLNLYVQDSAELIKAEVVEGERVDTPAPAAWSGATPATHSEKNKTVWSGTLSLPPLEEGALRFDYRVPGVVRTVGGRSTYRLQVQHQPKIQPERLIIRMDLPEGASEIDAPGWKRDGDKLVWDRPLKEDIVLEVSWRR